MVHHDCVTSDQRIWVVPVNDLEASEIVYLLDQCKEQVILSRQPWGASWAGLEPQLAEFLALQQADLGSGFDMIGIELQGAGPAGARTIDHHRYPSDDRSNSLSSLEQVAELLGVSLNRWQRIVAVNDRAYIPGLRAEIENLEAWELREVRLRDRRAQGVTWQHDQCAREVVRLSEHRGGAWWVALSAPANSSISDVLMLERQAEEWVVAAPDNWVYSGPRVADFWNLPIAEHRWSGGDPRFGYFGVEKPSPETQAAIRALFWTRVTN